jgi:hypothetical protein
MILFTGLLPGKPRRLHPEKLTSANDDETFVVER